MKLDFNVPAIMAGLTKNIADANLEIVIEAKSRIEVSNTIPRATDRMRKSLFVELDRSTGIASLGLNTGYAYRQNTEALLHVGNFGNYVPKGFIKIGEMRRKYLTAIKIQKLKTIRPGSKEFARREDVISRFKKNSLIKNYGLGYGFATKNRHSMVKRSTANSLEWGLAQMTTRMPEIYEKWILN